MNNTQRIVGVAALVGGGLVLLLGAGSGPTISGEEAHALVAKQGALLLDVRTPDEFAAGHIEGATNIPVDELDAHLATFPAKKDQHIVIYCHSGTRSARAAEVLKKAGYAKVHDLGGKSNWK